MSLGPERRTVVVSGGSPDAAGRAPPRATLPVRTRRALGARSRGDRGSASEKGRVAVEEIDRSDEELLRDMTEGDVAALEVFYARYGGVTFALARRITGDPET